MKNMILVVLLVSMMAIAIGLVGRALDAPVIYKDPSNNTCGCIKPGCTVPSLACCEGINEQELHEVIRVSACK